MKRIISLALAVLMAVSLTACSNNAAQNDRDPSLIHGVTGHNPDEVIMTVDGRDVTLEMYLYGVLYTIDYISSSYGDDYVDDAGLLQWDKELESGVTLAQYVKDEALNTAVMYATVENWESTYDLTLTQEQEDALDSELDYMAEQLGGQEAFDEYLYARGLSAETNRRLSRIFYLYSNMQQKALDPSSPLYITDEALYQYEGITEDTILADHILLPISEDEEQNEQTLEMMKQIKELLDNAGDDVESMFNYLANTYSQDTGRTYYPNGYPITKDADYVQEFKDAAFALEEGEYSDVITSEFGYHIVMRKPLRLFVVDSYLSGLLKEAIDTAEIEYAPLYEELDIPTFQADYLTYVALHTDLYDPEEEDIQDTDSDGNADNTGNTDNSGNADNADNSADNADNAGSNGNDTAANG